jgi:Ca-activated chloride channel family protein
MELFSANVQWREPAWLWLMLWPLLWMGLASLRRLQRSPLIEPHLLPWMQVGVSRGLWRRLILSLISIIAWCLLVIALAGPRQAEYLYDKQSLAVRDVMIVLDVSHSMSADDVEPNRLQRGVLEIQSLLQQSRYTRYGLIVYAGRAHLLAPLSSDPQLLVNYLEAIDNQLLPSEGSNLLAGLELAVDELQNSRQEARAIWLLSDGELDRPMASQQADWQSLLDTLKAQHITVFATGIGSKSGTGLLSKNGWLQHQGEQLITRLQAQWLQQLVNMSDGHYTVARVGDGDRQIIYDRGIAQMAMPFDEKLSKSALHWQALHQPYLLAGLGLLLLGLFGITLPKRVSRHALLPLVMLVTMSGSHSLAASDQAQARKAHDYYQQQQYAMAEQAYTRVSGYRGRFGQGSAVYKQQNFQAAVEQFTLAFLKAADDRQRAVALFNLANSYFQLGDYKKAARIYSDVMQYDSNIDGAGNNRELALALQAEVDKFVMESVTQRSGSGPRTARAAEDMALDDTRLTLGDEDTGPAQAYIPLSQQQLYHLVLRGAEFQISSQQQQADDEDYQWLIDQQINLSQAQQRVVNYRDGFVFWRNLFEYEEGFPAPVAEPITLPGQTPW